jgi:hypothetical protein
MALSYLSDRHESAEKKKKKRKRSVEAVSPLSPAFHTPLSQALFPQVPHAFISVSVSVNISVSVIVSVSVSLHTIAFSSYIFASFSVPYSTRFEDGFFAQINGYRDVWYANRDNDNAEELSRLYTLHIVDHVRPLSCAVRACALSHTHAHTYIYTHTYTHTHTHTHTYKYIHTHTHTHTHTHSLTHT